MPRSPNSLKYLPKTDSRFPHDRYLGYQYGCRCKACVKAVREYMADWRRRRGTGQSKVNPHTPYVPQDRRRIHGHGTRACYQRGCRRDECVEANRAYARERQRLYRRDIHDDPWIKAALAD